MKVDKCYLLKGGHILRFRGLYANEGPMLAFQPPTAEYWGIPVGYSAPRSHVIQEITAADRSWLLTRRQNALARNLHDEVEQIDRVLSELA